MALILKGEAPLHVIVPERLTWPGFQLVAPSPPTPSCCHLTIRTFMNNFTLTKALSERVHELLRMYKGRDILLCLTAMTGERFQKEGIKTKEGITMTKRERVTRFKFKV